MTSIKIQCRGSITWVDVAADGDTICRFVNDKGRHPAAVGKSLAAYMAHMGARGFSPRILQRTET